MLFNSVSSNDPIGSTIYLRNSSTRKIYNVEFIKNQYEHFKENKVKNSNFYRVQIRRLNISLDQINILVDKLNDEINKIEIIKVINPNTQEPFGITFATLEQCLVANIKIKFKYRPYFLCGIKLNTHKTIPIDFQANIIPHLKRK